MLQVAVINDYMRIVAQMADWERLRGRAQVHFFHDHLDSEDALACRLAGFDVIVSERERTRFTASLLSRLPRLRLLCLTGTDNWAVDFDATRRQGITVCNTQSVMAAMPELAWGLILALTRGIVRDDRVIKAGGWQTRPTVPLQGKTLGILGLGIAGRRMLEIAQAFRMQCVAWSSNLTAEAVADITSSGETLRANHLKILSDGLILQSQAELFLSHQADWDGTSRATLARLVAQLGLPQPEL